MKRVLVVDDNRLMRMLVQASLKPLGCEIREAVDGEQALEVAREFRPDVIVLDVIMPKMDGFEVLAHLREDDSAADCRVAMLTTANSEDDHTKARLHHADAYIAKPFDHQELCDSVRALLDA